MNLNIRKATNGFIVTKYTEENGTEADLVFTEDDASSMIEYVATELDIHDQIYTEPQQLAEKETDQKQTFTTHELPIAERLKHLNTSNV